MTLLKPVKAFLGSISDLDIVIVSLCFSILFFIILAAIILDLFEKLEIKRVYKFSIPIFSIAALVIFAGVSTVTVNSHVCSLCHPMRSAADELASSVHSNVSCGSCHKKAGMTGTPVQNLQQLRMISNYVRGDYTTPISSTVSNKACMSCHKDITDGVRVRYRVKMSHREVVDDDIACVECHEDTAHIAKHDDTSMMEKCSGCHNDETVSARCDVCHQDKVWLGNKPSGNWAIKHDKDWPKLHGARSLYACKYCHTDKDCARCHTTNVPHPEGWSFVHSDEAKSNRDDCGICHKNESTCLGCHKVEMPHPSNWLPVHQWKVKAAGEKACLQCHNKKDCKDCHDSHGKSIKKMKVTTK